MSLLLCKELVVGYQKESPLTYPISLHLKEGGIYGLIGPNGSGKSTLLKTLLGLIKPLSGQMVCSKRISYVPQSHMVNPYFSISVEQFIRQGLGPSGQDRSVSGSIFPLLKAWQLEKYASSSFHALSGGQKTRALILRAMIGAPQLLFLDEPLASLDVCCQDQLMETLSQAAQKQGMGIVMVDHHWERFKGCVKGWLDFHRHHDEERARVHLRLGELKPPTCQHEQSPNSLVEG